MKSSYSMAWCNIHKFVSYENRDKTAHRESRHLRPAMRSRNAEVRSFPVFPEEPESRDVHPALLHLVRPEIHLMQVLRESESQTWGQSRRARSVPGVRSESEPRHGYDSFLFDSTQSQKVFIRLSSWLAQWLCKNWFKTSHDSKWISQIWFQLTHDSKSFHNFDLNQLTTEKKLSESWFESAHDSMMLFIPSFVWPS